MNLKLSYIVILTLILSFSYSCDSETQEEEDQDLIEQFIADNKINATKHSSGLWYEIKKAGNSSHPTTSSTVNVDYKGTLLDGSTFDSGDKVVLKLGQTITGWKVGIPLIGKGGEILLIIPSEMGYGSYSQGGIPANSVLVFEVKLNSFL